MNDITIEKRRNTEESQEKKDDDNEEELYTLNEAITGIVKGNENFINDFIKENKEKINEFVKNNQEKIQRTFGNTSTFLDNLSEKMQQNIFQKFDKLKSDVINTTTSVASEVVVTAGLTEEQAAATLAIQMLGKINSQIEEIIKNKNIQNLFDKLLFLNQYISGNVENIQKLVRDYINVVFSPLIMTNRVFFDNMMLYIKKIIILYQKIPQIKIQNTQKIMDIIDEGIKNNILTEEQKEKLSQLITSQLIDINEISKKIQTKEAISQSLKPPVFLEEPLKYNNNNTNNDTTNPNNNSSSNIKTKKGVKMEGGGGGGGRSVKTNKTKKIMENIKNSLNQYKMLNSSLNEKNKINKHKYSKNKTKRIKWK